MLLDNLLNHLQELKQIHGGKIHIHLQVETEDCGTIETSALTILKHDDQIHIRNF